MNRVIEMSLNDGVRGEVICSRLLKDYEHGMKLIRDKLGRREFLITEEAIEDPEGYLNRVIREIYSRQSTSRVQEEG